VFAAPRVERRRCAAPILVRSGVCWRVRCLTRREPSGHCVRGVWCVLLRGVLSCVRCSEPVGTSFVTPWPDAVDRSASNSSSSRCAPGSPSKRGNGPPVEPPPHAHAPMMVSALASGAKHMLNLHPCTATLHGQAALTRLRSALKQWLRAPHTLCVAWCAHVCVCVCFLSFLRCEHVPRSGMGMCTGCDAFSNNLCVLCLWRCWRTHALVGVHSYGCGCGWGGELVMQKRRSRVGTPTHRVHLLHPVPVGGAAPPVESEALGHPSPGLQR